MEPDRLVKICHSLVNFYNASILKNAPVQLQEAFFRETQDCFTCTNIKQDGRERKILAKLIKNFFDDKRPNVRFIGGPKTLTLHWSEKYKKLIYIFGEEHFKPIDCNKDEISQLSIQDYLYNLIVYSSSFIDLYCEFPAFGAKQIAYDPKYKHGFVGEGKLKDLITKFQICVDKQTRDQAVQCSLARIHYFDIRKRYKKDTTVNLSQISIFRRKIQIALNKQDKISSFQHLLRSDTEFMTVVSIINNITESDISAYNKFWISQIRSNKFVMKKLNRSTMKKEILEFLDTKMLKRCASKINGFNKNMKIIIENTDNSNEIVIPAWKKIMELIIGLEALEADAYLLGRVFKKFDISKRPSDEPIKPHNIIIYCGNRHSILYREFLKSIGFDRIESTTRGTDSCIDMTGITQPLFSFWPTTKFDMDDGEDKNNDTDIGYNSDEDDQMESDDVEEDDPDYESYIDDDDSKVNPEIPFPKDIFGQYGNFSSETTNEKQDAAKTRPNPYANSKDRRRR